jgi:hypothetical protein
MTYDPNLPPSSRDPSRHPDVTTSRASGSTGWMIGLLVLALVIVGAFFVWPNRTSDVAGTEPATTGTTATRPADPAPATTAPATPPPAAPAPAAPAPVAPAPATPAPATPPQ